MIVIVFYPIAFHVILFLQFYIVDRRHIWKVIDEIFVAQLNVDRQFCFIVRSSCCGNQSGFGWYRYISTQPQISAIKVSHFARSSAIVVMATENLCVNID